MIHITQFIRKQSTYGNEQYEIKPTNTSTSHNLKDQKEWGEQYTLINLSTKTMRREVLTPLWNEKVTYIEFQGDLWVTLTFGFSHSQSVPWNFSSLNYINKENRSLFIFSYLFKLHKILKIIITRFTRLFYNIVQFILLYFGNFFLMASCWVKILFYRELKICSLFTSRVICYSLNISMSTTNLCTKVV